MSGSALWLRARGAGEAQVGGDRQFEEVGPQEPRREEEDLQAFDLAGVGIQPCDDLIRQFLRFLLRIGRALVDMKDVGLPVISECQLRFHSTSPFR